MYDKAFRSLRNMDIRKKWFDYGYKDLPRPAFPFLCVSKGVLYAQVFLNFTFKRRSFLCKLPETWSCYFLCEDLAFLDFFFSSLFSYIKQSWQLPQKEVLFQKPQLGLLMISWGLQHTGWKRRGQPVLLQREERLPGRRNWELFKNVDARNAGRYHIGT